MPVQKDGMMKKMMRWLSVFAALAIMVSCASGPKEKTPKPAPAKSVEEAKASADQARNLAVEKKAPQAAAAEFESAQKLYDKAAGASDDKKAIDLYGQAAAAFQKAAQMADDARMAAEKAIRDAKKAISDTEMKAEQAKKTAMEENS